ncbi:tudor domain-containing protein 1 isoform X2 [Halichoeres trimaculatus]|uniref:tudor domain-containing protein 1 isoform X2 n=1 Tax=Halichoeres trimaculatus TaxID=147232 RepID=UPI003D9E3B86
MHRAFSPNTVRPNPPLRKPWTSPMGSPIAAPPLRFAISDATAAHHVQRSAGDGVGVSPVRNTSPFLGPMSPVLGVYNCNYCGHKANWRCKRCKKTPYCSVSCQTNDWGAHKIICSPVPESAMEQPKVTVAPTMTEDKAILPQSKPEDAPSEKRVYFKDLHVTKVIKGSDIQATLAEFYSPSRFFLVAQSPEVLDALQSISMELQRSYSCPSTAIYIPHVGEICAVQFSSDKNWYRGLVQTLAADQKMANVLYIDFGNEEQVPMERIKPLADNIKPFCPCAMECRIASVVPAGGNWSSECCLAVRQLLASKFRTVKLVETLENGYIHAVDIQLYQGKLLSSFLLEHGYGVEETVNVTPTEQDINAMVSASLENFKRLSKGKDDNSWAQPPEPLTQAVGDSFSVIVTHIQSPDDIIVQKVENAGAIQQLQLQLREHCAQAPAPQNFRPAPGTVCCAQFSEDKQWYRAKVLAYSSEDHVCVGYLDFGNSEEVDLGHLLPISTALLALPMQAMPCGLAGVRPAEESWSKDCLLALQRRIFNRILRIEIQRAHEGKALVALIDESSDPQANVAELLTYAGFAVPAPVSTNSDQQTSQAADAAEEPQVPTPACEPLKWSCAELPSEGQTVELLASVVENPGDFYCHINNPTAHQQLMELGAELKQHCEAQTAPFVPKEGEPCCAMFPDDGAWYRAMVNKVYEDKVSVNFVDYGYSMKVGMNQLRSITPKLLTLPFQAIHCSLSGVEPLGSEWTSEALSRFQIQVYGKQLSARVLSVTEQGYSVKLESRGQNVAAALISEQLAKAPGELPKEAHAANASEAKQQEKIDKKEHSQIRTEAKEALPEIQTAALSEAPSFPVEWKTVELPLNETFQPYIAAIINPSLFYLPSPRQVNQEKLQEVMLELAVYCRNNQASLSSAALSRPAPGAACCAQFSADNNWYRAVVLEVGDNELSIIYADYGNTEKVPFSRVMPITSHLLQLPFRITRCTLTGKDHFPTEWTAESQQMFQNLLANGVLATVLSFDGSTNILSLTLPIERGGGNVTAMILDAIQAEAKSNSQAPTTQIDQTDFSCGEPMPNCPQTQESTPTNATQEAAPGLNPQKKNSPTESVNANNAPAPKIVGQMGPPCQVDRKNDDPQASGCCCPSLATKIDHLEELIQLQLSLIRQLMGQTK